MSGLTVRQHERYRRAAAAAGLAEHQRQNFVDVPGDWADWLRQGVCEIDSNGGSGTYTVTEQRWDAGAGPAAWTDATAPRHVARSARDYRGRKHGRSGEYVRFWEQRTKAGALEVLIDVGQAEAFFAVLVWVDGGTTNGDKSHQCDRTYTVKTLDGATTLGTGRSPKKRRPGTGKLSTPSSGGNGVVGLGYYDNNGNFQLYDANETLDTKTCD